MPTFSIIIPTYNRARFLSRTIQSVLAQTCEDWELVIVDDGSVDDTRQVVASFHDSRIRYVYQENAERSAARNNGIRHATGEWICFLDSDDEYQPEHLIELYHYITSQKITTGLTATGIKIRTGDVLIEKPFLTIPSENILKEIWTKFLIPTQVCVHRKIIQNNQFDIRYRLWEDTHLWLRIVASHPVYQLEKYTCIQNVHDDSTVQQGMKKIKWGEVSQYVNAINDLFNNYKTEIQPYLNEADRRAYIDQKYRMYLYQARKNRQRSLAYKIWQHALKNRPSFYLCTEFLKIPFG